MDDYYTQRLSGERLRRCYEIAPPRVQRYLRAEIEHVLERLEVGGQLLELGCGYGRALEALVGRAGSVFGIDVSLHSLQLARSLLSKDGGCHLARMDASRLAFSDRRFDLVICVQNGISAFHVDRRMLIAEAARVTRLGGKVLFSSYSGSFWESRLEWFRIQAELGLIGEIDKAATADGVIVCKDGFRATTVGAKEFVSLSSALGLVPTIAEVDGSSLFCELTM